MKVAKTIVAMLAVLAVTGCYSVTNYTGDTGTDAGGDTWSDTSADPVVDTRPDGGTDTMVDPTDVPTDVPVDLPPGTCGGGTGVGCPPGSFCEVAEGVCDPDLGYGVCVEVPTGGCPEYYMPECGCDAVTYGNPCERRQARAQLMHPGECGTEVVCAPWMEECPDGQMCDAPVDSCWVDGVMGTCRTIRDDCGFLWDPQCGCDGVTYENECERMRAGVWIDHLGECGPPCGLPGYPSCLPEQFCEFPTGFCEGPGMQGECMDVPMGCPDLYDPVCGCDAVTYGNDCERQSARVSLAHRGPC